MEADKDKDKKLFEKIETFLVKNAVEINNLKTKLIEMHAKYITPLKEKGINIKKLKFVKDLVENFKGGKSFDYEITVFDNDEYINPDIDDMHLLFTIVNILYLIICSNKNDAEIEELNKKLDGVKFEYDDTSLQKDLQSINDTDVEEEKPEEKKTERKGFFNGMRNMVPNVRKIFSKKPSLPSTLDSLSGIATGGNLTKYKSTGNTVFIKYKNKKYKKTIYTKENKKTRYCKINNEYILLSKLDVM